VAVDLVGERAKQTKDNKSMREVVLEKTPVELFKILKFEGLAASGGEAKSLIADGQVTVNGRVETRKRKQIVPGDVIEVGGEQLRMRL